MSIPYFFAKNLTNTPTEIQLDEDNARHALQVLRMKKGDTLWLTDGNGTLLKASILNDHKKNCQVRILEKKIQSKAETHVSIAISLLKNSSRFEWLLEKCTEIGVAEIFPLICERTEKQKIRMDRLNNIIISALLQSQQAWMPQLHEPSEFSDIVTNSKAGNKFIAHCQEENKKELVQLIKAAGPSRFILIGPEGDFSSEEIALSIKNGFVPVSMGNNRLRSETAAVVAAAILQME